MNGNDYDGMFWKEWWVQNPMRNTTWLERFMYPFNEYVVVQSLLDIPDGLIYLTSP